MIDIGMLHPHPDNPRKDLGDLTELAESIKAQGVLQNLTVVPWFSSITGAGEDDSGEQEKMGYTVVVGHRRLAAAKLAGATELPCAVSGMGRRQQVAAMLAENIQRASLTLLEEAHGIQMLIDFGDSIADIANKTGLSETTVRHRAKLLDLDPAKLEAAVGRQATLQDLVKLEQIKDGDLKNQTLEKIGTNNFDWALRQALAKEERDGLKPGIRAQLEGFAEETDEKQAAKMVYVQYIHVSDDTTIKKPEDAGKAKYYFTEKETSSILDKEKTKGSKAQKSKAEAEREERQQKLTDLAKQAYESRLAFAKGFRIIAKKTDAVDKMAIDALLRTEFAEEKMLRDFFGIEKKFRLEWEAKNDDNGETKDEAIKRIIQQGIGNYNGNLIFASAYCAIEPGAETCADSYTGAYRANSRLARLYGHLAAAGYEASSEEAAMLDGTHGFYARAGQEGG
jgi:ParB family chromosome partitioning protein